MFAPRQLDRPNVIAINLAGTMPHAPWNGNDIGEYSGKTNMRLYGKVD
jgi:hypothetical protein